MTEPQNVSGLMDQIHDLKAQLASTQERLDKVIDTLSEIMERSRPYVAADPASYILELNGIGVADRATVRRLERDLAEAEKRAAVKYARGLADRLQANGLLALTSAPLFLRHEAAAIESGEQSL